MDYRQVFEKSDPLDGAPYGQIRISPAGHVLKRHTEPGKAQQEFRASCLARTLLPAELRPYEYVDWDGDFFITNQVAGLPMVRTDGVAVRRAAEYLGRMHSAPVSRKSKVLLRRHYVRKILAKRLKNEVGHVAQGFGRQAAERMRAPVEKVAQRVKAHRDIVVGHGDFYAGNILVTASGIHPVDWVDFGLCLRAYEVAHFITSVEEDLRMTAMKIYSANASGLSAKDFALGVSVSSIVRAGSYGRSAARGKGVCADLERRCNEHLDSLEKAVDDWHKARWTLR